MPAPQDLKINSCRHFRLRAALQYPGSAPARSATPRPEVEIKTARGESFIRRSGALAMLAVLYFVFASFVAVDYSDWESPTDKGEIAICQTSEDGQTRIITITNPATQHS